MESIKKANRQAGFISGKFLFICILFFLIRVSAGFAQDAASPAGIKTLSTGQAGQPSGTALASEIESIKSVLNNKDAKTASVTDSRQDALIRLARLQQLSGDLETASGTWLAAAAEQGGGNDAALVSGAFCMAAMGEWDRALAIIAPILRENRQNPALLRARYLSACARAWSNGDASDLSVMAQNPEFKELHSAVYWTLWRLAGIRPGMAGAGSAALWKARLLDEFPQSPEARIAAAENPAQPQTPAISALPSLHWLLLPVQEDLIEILHAATAPVQSAPISAPPQQQAPPAQSSQPAQSSRILQTGLFSVEANAKNQMDKLLKAGFSASIARRTVQGKEFWAVTVPAGSNMAKTVDDLKKAGFDSFPL